MKSSLKSTTAIVTGTLGFGLMVTGALGADIDPGCVPAVSGLNGKLEGAGGYYQEDDSGDGDQFRGVGMLDVPLGCYFGLQLDMGGGDFGGNKWAGIGGHLFMRDPDAYLLGIQAQYISLDGEEIVRVGPEAELYLGDFTLSMMAGWEGADDFDMDDIVGQLEAAYYMDDNFKIFGGYRHFLGVDAAAIGFEFKPQSMPASLFVDAMFGTDEYVSVVGGLRIHFGVDTKSLKDTHRYDDPGHYFNLLRAPTNRQYAPPPVVDSPCPGDSCPKAP